MLEGKEGYFRKTFTRLADEADDFFSEIENDLNKNYEWVDISPSMPVFFNSKLHYTATITAGSLV